MTMNTVGVRDLRQKLSTYLDVAKAGHKVAITERGRIVARLVPPEVDPGDRLEALRNAGLIRWSGRRLPPAEPVARLRGRKLVAELVSGGTLLGQILNLQSSRPASVAFASRVRISLHTSLDCANQPGNDGALRVSTK
ncbi:type II toxin-antitoxin system prevent-host-death family antitoxin [Candidatus Fermentibacteria bacterium]|nr:type II toxin-antitoxin system prevent-host-death family antitoxin [Candidatus Fermentibacteria bacterium]